MRSSSGGFVSQLTSNFMDIPKIFTRRVAYKKMYSGGFGPGIKIMNDGFIKMRGFDTGDSYLSLFDILFHNIYHQRTDEILNILARLGVSESTENAVLKVLGDRQETIRRSKMSRAKVVENIGRLEQKLNNKARD